jgi:hypothetical protein
MKDKRHIQTFEQHQENLNISDVSGRYSLDEAKKFAKEKFNSDSLKNKFPRGGWVRIDDILSVLEVGVECGYKFGKKSNDH